MALRKKQCLPCSLNGSDIFPPGHQAGTNVEIEEHAKNNPWCAQLKQQIKSESRCFRPHAAFLRRTDLGNHMGNHSPRQCTTPRRRRASSHPNFQTTPMFKDFGLSSPRSDPKNDETPYDPYGSPWIPSGSQWIPMCDTMDSQGSMDASLLSGAGAAAVVVVQPPSQRLRRPFCSGRLGSIGTRIDGIQWSLIIYNCTYHYIIICIFFN